MRILQIGFSPLYGGVESFVINYWERLKPYGIEFDFLSIYDHIAYEDSIKSAGGIIHYVADPKKKPLKFFKQLVSIAKNYDVVHINMLSAANSLPIYACRRAGVKNIIIHSHNSRTERLDRFLLHYINKAVINKMNLKRVACSDVAAKWMFTRKNCDDYYLIHNAIDLSKYGYSERYRQEIRNEFFVEDDTLLIGSVGHLTAQKNPLFLLDVLYGVIKSNDNVRLMYVGSGDLNEAVREKASILGIDKYIIYTGVRRDVERFYSAFDVFCMPSLYEGLSFTAVEAQASGVKCFFSIGMSVETGLLPETEFLPIDDSSRWSDSIIMKSYERNDSAFKYLKNKGFDIESETEKLEKYYMRLGDKD